MEKSLLHLRTVDKAHKIVGWSKCLFVGVSQNKLKAIIRWGTISAGYTTSKSWRVVLYLMNGNATQLCWRLLLLLLVLWLLLFPLLHWLVGLFLKKGPIPASFSVYFRLFNMLQFKLKKRRWCAWESNPGRQDGRRKRIHWATAAPLVGLVIVNVAVAM